MPLGSAVQTLMPTLLGRLDARRLGQAINIALLLEEYGGPFSGCRFSG